MNTLLDKEYVHNGTSVIYKELWNKIYMNPANTNYGYIKPTGGFWTSNYSSDNLSSWLEYLLDECPDMLEEALLKDNIILKLYSNSKLLTIENKNDFMNLRDSNLTTKLNKPSKILYQYDYTYINEILDYEKIAQLYDAIYVNPYADKSLYNYSVPTMLIMNPNIIEYFKKVNAYYDETQKRIIVNNIGKPELISNVDESYYKLVNVIKSEFNKLVNNIKTINDLAMVKNELQNKFINSKDIDFLINKNLSKKDIIDTILHNLEVDNSNLVKRLIKK